MREAGLVGACLSGGRAARCRGGSGAEARAVNCSLAHTRPAATRVDACWRTQLPCPGSVHRAALRPSTLSFRRYTAKEQAMAKAEQSTRAGRNWCARPGCAALPACPLPRTQARRCRRTCQLMLVPVHLTSAVARTCPHHLSCMGGRACLRGSDKGSRMAPRPAAGLLMGRWPAPGGPHRAACRRRALVPPAGTATSTWAATGTS